MVADFGIARAFGNDASATATATGVVGSPAYMSPEQWRGEKVDGRADQYALGVLAFELLTGTRPFADASMQELLRMHLAEDPPDIISFRDDLASHTTDAVWHAMAKDPADRFVSATAFVDALSGDSEPRTSRPRIAPPIPNEAISGKTTVKHVTPQPRARTPAPSKATMPRQSSRTRPTPVSEETEAAAPRSSPWLAILLLLVIGGAAGAIVVGRMNKNADAARAKALPVALAAPESSALADSVKAEADQNAKLQEELADARKAALSAEHKAELLSQAAAVKNTATPGQKAESAPVAAPVEPPHAHIVVLARGGAPAVFVDGKQTVNNAPTVVEVPPGHHVVSVRGLGSNQFNPSEYSLDLAPEDTQQVIFVSQRAAANQLQRQQAAAAANNAAGGSATDSTPAPSAGLTPAQRQRYKTLDSLRRAAKRPYF
jgi:hypothetical protein